MEIKGGFQLGDTPDRIKRIFPDVGVDIGVGIMAEIVWKPRKNGLQPANSIVSADEIATHNKDFLLNFYKSKTKWILIESCDKNVKRKRNSSNYFKYTPPPPIIIFIR